MPLLDAAKFGNNNSHRIGSLAGNNRSCLVRASEKDGPPRSDASRRTLAIPEPLVNLLADHLHRKGFNASNPDALVFTAPDGGAIPYANWRNRVWVPACKAVGLPSMGFHDLRRLSTTTLVREAIGDEITFPCAS